MYIKPMQMSRNVIYAIYTQLGFSLQRNWAVNNIFPKVPACDALPIVFTHKYFGVYIPKAWMAIDHIQDCTIILLKAPKRNLTDLAML